MAKSSPEKLKYNTEYEASPEMEKRRVERNKARRHALKAGKVHVGDGLEVDHKVMLNKGGAATDANTRVIPASENRAWRKSHPETYGKSKK